MIINVQYAGRCFCRRRRRRRRLPPGWHSHFCLVGSVLTCLFTNALIRYFDFGSDGILGRLVHISIQQTSIHLCVCGIMYSVEYTVHSTHSFTQAEYANDMIFCYPMHSYAS